jgi:hypothetical protein
MLDYLTNDTVNLVPAVIGYINNDDSPKNWKVHNFGQISSRSTVHMVIKPEDFIWLELSLVKGVESVSVCKDSGVWHVQTVVNERDAKMRAQIYSREKAIMEYYPGARFDFHIIARMGRDLKDIISTVGRKAFSR